MLHQALSNTFCLEENKLSKNSALASRPCAHQGTVPVSLKSCTCGLSTVWVVDYHFGRANKQRVVSTREGDPHHYLPVLRQGKTKNHS